MYWGLTPALDLQLEAAAADAEEDLNLLLVGGSDARHVLLTLACRHRRPERHINFYLVEANMEMVARQLLLISIAAEADRRTGLALRARTFMELYGNSLVRPATARRLSERARLLVDLVGGKGRLMPFVSTAGLRYKERDYLETVLKFWSDATPFEIAKIWDSRLRRHLGNRYDTRIGVFDWDLHMQLKYRGADAIGPGEYKNWRETGVAYTWLDCEFSKPNRSLVTSVVQRGESYVCGGYGGDIETGPYIAFGINCEDEGMMKKSNGTNVHRSTDITERNITRMLSEITFNRPYEPPQNDQKSLGLVSLANPDFSVVDSEGTPSKRALEANLQLNDASINFLSFKDMNRFIHEPKYKKLFNVVYIGLNYANQCSQEMIENVCANGAIVVAESQKFIPSIRKEQSDTQIKDVSEAFLKCDGCTKLETEKDDGHMRFMIK